MHLLTVKIPEPLHKKLDHFSGKSGISKGAVVRNALEKLLDESNESLELIKQITAQLKKNTLPQVESKWHVIRQKVSGKSCLTPEEEVLQSRQRIR